jgi:hypothetical protein
MSHWYRRSRCTRGNRFQARNWVDGSDIDQRGVQTRNVIASTPFLRRQRSCGAYHPSQSVFAIRQDPQIRVLSSTTAPEHGLYLPLCIRIQVPHHDECLAARPRCLDAPGENLKLMPLASPSMTCFNECAIDPHYHSLSWFGDNTRMIDFLADLLFNAFADSERSVACRGII